jgi:Lon protease-like protein
MFVSTTLPIFPLNTVLFPGGTLPLRIFETRYIDMVRDCLRDESEFGVCLIKKGSEVAAAGGAPTEPEAIGCRARIVDWNMEQLGVLQINVQGTERFHIQQLVAEPSGLLRAEVHPLEAEAHFMITSEYEACASLLARIIQQMKQDAEVNQDASGKEFFAEPHRLNDASWVSNRLCEVLPISLVAKQKLMELTDAPTRLSLVHQYLQQHKVV